MTDETKAGDAKPASTPESRLPTERRWRKGQSGNPSGRPKSLGDIQKLARSYAPEAITRLAELMRSRSAKVAIAACRELLDRGYGKAAQPVTGADGVPLLPTIVAIDRPIVDALSAAAIYAQLMEGTSVDITRVRFEPPEPAALPMASPDVIDVAPVEPPEAVTAEPVPARHGEPREDVAPALVALQLGLPDNVVPMRGRPE